MAARSSHPRTRILLHASSRRARVVFGVLATLACAVGLVRSAFPTRAFLTAGLSVTPVISVDSYSSSSDEGSPTIDEARLPRTGLRRAVLTGPSLTDNAPPPALLVDTGGLPSEREMLAPRSFIPTPPFHPPRAARVV